MLNLTDENFEREIKNSTNPVLVDFWMFGCPPCSFIAPILEKIAEDYKDKLTLAKINLNNSSLTAQKYGIEAAPTIILFKKGKPVSGFVGHRPEGDIKKWLDNNLEN